MKLFPFLCALLLGSSAIAEFDVGAITAAAGGTGRAAVDAGTAGFMNPAMMVHQHGMQFFTAWTQDLLAFSLTENTDDSLLPSSLGYLQQKLELKNGILTTDYKAQDIRFSLAEFINGGFSVGLTGHYYQVQSPEKSIGQGNLDIGFALTPVPNIGLALVFYDLGGSNQEIPPELRLSPTAGVGFHYLFREYFRSRLDLVSGPNQNFAKSTVRLGFESYLNKWVIARAGYQSNHFLNTDLVSMGFGFDLPLFRTNYAFQFESTDTKEQRHSVDLAIPF